MKAHLGELVNVKSARDRNTHLKPCTVFQPSLIVFAVRLGFILMSVPFNTGRSQTKQLFMSDFWLQRAGREVVEVILVFGFRTA